MDRLEVPDALTGSGIQRQYAVPVQVAAFAIRAVPVHGRGVGGDVDDAALLIERHVPPVVVAASVFVGFRWVALVAELAGPGYSVEGPRQLTGANVVRTDVARLGAVAFSCRRAEDQE